MRECEQETTDVLVIGGGPAGSAAALRLARAGFGVIQLEQRVFNHPRNDALRSGEGIIARAGRELEALGIDPRSARWARTPVDQIAFHWPHGAVKHIQLAPDAIVHVDREQLDADVFRAAQAAGVDSREGWRVRDLLFGEHGVQGALAQAPGEQTVRTIHARVVIDAGGRSAISIRRLKLRTVLPGHDFFAMAMFFDDVAELADGKWEMHFFDAAQLAVVQLSRIAPGVVRCGLGTTRATFRNAGLDPQAFFWQRLGAAPELRARFANSRTVRAPFARVAIGYGVQSVAFDGLVLAGDATGYVNPIFGDGMLRALRDGRVVAAAVEGALKRGECTQAAFASYQRRHAIRSTRDRALARLLACGYEAPRLLKTIEGMRRVPQALLHSLRWY